MHATQQDLIDAACWFDSDKAGGTEMTAFKREARWRQRRWAVDELVYRNVRHAPRVGVPTRTSRQRTSTTAPSCSTSMPKQGANFLTSAIHQIAKDRVGAKQDHETLDDRRLHRDLLSSMPMAFNLFGEASQPENDVSRDRLADTVRSNDRRVVVRHHLRVVTREAEREVHAGPHRLRYRTPARRSRRAPGL